MNTSKIDFPFPTWMMHIINDKSSFMSDKMENSEVGGGGQE
jgi:hypothetical protein